MTRLVLKINASAAIFNFNTVPRITVARIETVQHMEDTVSRERFQRVSSISPEDEKVRDRHARREYRAQ